MHKAYQGWFELCAYTAALFFPIPTYQQCWSMACEITPLAGNHPTNPLRFMAGC